MSRPPEYLLPAMQLFRQGKLSQALAAAETALAEHPADQPLLALASLAALQLGSPERALAHLRAHHELAPADEAVKANLATALAETGAPDEALALAAGSPMHTLARLEGYLRQEAGEAEAAMAAYARAVAARPEDVQSWNNLGNLRAADDDFDGAIDAFERAIHFAPDQAAIYRNLSDVLSRADRQGPRLVTTTAGLKRCPDDPELLTEHGLALVANERHDDAVSVFQEAVELLSGQPQKRLHSAHIELGIQLENLNRIGELEALVAALRGGGHHRCGDRVSESLAAPAAGRSSCGLAVRQGDSRDHQSGGGPHN